MTSDTVLFSSDRNDLDGRSLSVRAERGYGDVVILKVSDDHGEVTLFFNDLDEISWLGNALIDAWAKLMGE